MYSIQTESPVRVPIHRWRNTRFSVSVRETRRHRSSAEPTVQDRNRARGSFTETDARTQTHISRRTPGRRRDFRLP